MEPGWQVEANCLFLSPFDQCYLKVIIVYRDRLGTNAGKTQAARNVFSRSMIAFSNDGVLSVVGIDSEATARASDVQIIAPTGMIRKRPSFAMPFYTTW